MTTQTATSTASQTTLRSTLDTSSIPIPRGPTTATLLFHGPPADGANPFAYVEDPPAGHPKKNYTEHPHKVTLSDIRGHESQYNLNEHAFATAQDISSAEKDFSSDSQIKATYYPETEALILAHVPGAQRVLLFDHTIRRSDPSAPRAPVTRVHIDQTGKSAAQRVRFHVPDAEEADALLAGRYRIINVWRPLNGPVVASPLAFAASASVPDQSVVPVEHRYPTRVGETAGIEFSEGQEWFYWSGMRDDERLFLQCFDSMGMGARVPHTAFVDERTRKEWPGRESIEVRALVFG